MKILVLGSKGVVGTSLVKFLKEIGHEVVDYDLVMGSEYDLRIKAPKMDNYDFVFFLASDVGGAKYLSEKNIEFINNNIQIMFNTFNKLKKSGVPFIFASSQLQNHNNPYGSLKRVGEHYTDVLNGISVRFWNVYGPEEINLKSHVICDFIDKFKKNGLIEIMTDGTEERQFLHVDDTAEVLTFIMNNFEKFKHKKIIDITSFEWTKIRDIALLITEDASKIIINNKKDTFQIIKNEPNTFILDYWNPRISLKKGIKELMNHL
jgi:nucleoside-diphosphate-sugar epimerase